MVQRQCEYSLKYQHAQTSLVFVVREITLEWLSINNPTYALIVVRGGHVNSSSIILRQPEIVTFILSQARWFHFSSTVRHRRMGTLPIGTILEFSSVPLKKIGTDLLGSWWP